MCSGTCPWLQFSGKSLGPFLGLLTWSAWSLERLWGQYNINHPGSRAKVLRTCMVVAVPCWLTCMYCRGKQCNAIVANSNARNAMLPPMSYQEFLTKSFLPRVSYQECNSKSVTPRISFQECHSTSVTPRVSLQAFLTKSVLPRVSLQECLTKSVLLMLQSPEWLYNCC